MSKYTTELRYVCERKAMVGEPLEYRTSPNRVVKRATQEQWDMLEPYLFEFPKYTVGSNPERYFILAKSVGEENVDTVLDFCWNHIFKPTPPESWTYDEEHYETLCKKILKHYYTREICCETVGLWILWLNERMEEIIPYYNGLYETTNITFEPLDDVDLHREHTKNETGHEATTSHNTVDETRTQNGSQNRSYGGETQSSGSTTEDRTGNKTDSGSKSDEYSYSDNSNSMDKYADTPQGSVSTPIFDSYLTNARNIITNGSGSSTDNIQSNNTENTTDNITGSENKTVANTGSSQTGTQENTTGNVTNDGTGSKDSTGNENLNEYIHGKQGSSSYSKMLQEFRETIMNIDSLVIREFRDLFFLLW